MKCVNTALKIGGMTVWLLAAIAADGNIPGGGTGTGSSVTLVNNGNGTVTMANGIVSILINTASADLTQINYTYNNGAGTQTQQLLAGGHSGGEFYWENAGFGSGSYAYSVVANNPNYCEVDLLATSATNGTMDVHFSMLRGSTGFYVTPIWSHRPADTLMTSVEGRDNIYVGSIFNWMSVSPRHDFETGVNQPLVPAFNSPQENELVTAGPMEGVYFDKYKYGEDFGGENAGEKVWGWSSVSDATIGFTGKNVGLWHVLSSAECYNGGPMKTELMEGESAYSLNMINGGHYGMGQALTVASGETWSKTYGPYFVYCNNVSNTLSGPLQASRDLFADAQAQAAAELTAWPYSWFTNANYTSAAQRGAITGQIVINDTYNPNATASNLWVGVVQQPAVSDGIYDPQQWAKPYQFWAKSDPNGNFTITNVIAGNNYILYSFGTGAAGTFLSQNQSGAPPFLYNLPANPFTVSVAGGTTTNLGAITWTPTRVGPTVFEIGYPDRTSGKFRHGDDWFVGDIGPNPTTPSPIWTKYLDYPFDYPNGVTYVVGQNRWPADWNFIQPEVMDTGGNLNASSSMITFNLPSAPAGGVNASLYFAFAGAYSGPTIITVNGVNLNTSVTGVTAAPVTPISSTGLNPAMSQSDVSVREGNHGAFSDERITFPASMLHVGPNSINIQMRKVNSSESFIMYDYIRLEMAGYVPPAPASVTAYPGNNQALLSWPVTPGATSYNILRSTTSGSGYFSITNGVLGPVCGSGPANATYVDNNANNDATYYYVVQSVNPVNVSSNSPQSGAVTPSAGILTNAPAAPSLVVTSTNSSVALSWSAVPGANFYTIQRGTVVNSTIAYTTDYIPFYITLNNTTTGTAYADTSGTLGCTYSYIVTATGAGGTSSNSVAVTAKPVPPAPANAPSNVKINDTITSTDQTAMVTWSPVSGAVGYILLRSTSPSGPFSFPANYVMSMTTTNWTDSGLNANTIYYYTVVAMNAGGASANSAIAGTLPQSPAAPASLSAIPGDSQVILNWAAVSGAAGYFLYQGTSSGNETTTVIANYSGTSYTNTGLANGTTYYYVVAATNSVGLGPLSPEVGATPDSMIAVPQSLIWKGDGSANLWNVSGSSNWLNGSAATTYIDGDSVAFDDTGSNNVPVTLAGALHPALVAFNASRNYTFSGAGSIAGTNKLIMAGSGVLTLGETNTYSNGTTVSNGLLTFSIGAAIPASGTLTLDNTGAVTVVTANPLPNVLVNGTNTIAGNGNSGTAIGTLNDSGSLTLLVAGGSRVFDLTGAMTGSGTLVLGSSPMTLRFNGTAGDGGAVFNLGSGGTTTDIRSGPTAIALGGLAGGAATQLQGALSSYGTGLAATYTIGGANVSAELDGVIADGTGAGNLVALVKTGSGVQTLAGANTYSGGTTINSGRLLVNNSVGSGLGSGVVNVANGGTLTGGGIISGVVTVQGGGALAPGNPLGTLTFGNNLTLAAGSTTYLQIQSSPLTNDAVMVSGALTENGTLNVTNIGGAGLVNGNSFKLFSAGSYSGAFANYVLPPLATNLVWNTNALAISGTLSVAAYLPPIIGRMTLAGTNFNVSGSGGIPGWTYYVFTATNLVPTRWIPIATNQFDAAGNFNFTKIVDLGSPQVFYRLQLQ